MPMLPKTKQQQNERNQQVGTKSVKFNDATECIGYVKMCGRQCVVLILSGHHAQDKTLIKEFKQCRQVVMIYRRVSREQFQQLSNRWSFGRLFSYQNRLSRKIIGTPVKNLDETSERQLIEMLFNKFIVRQPQNVQEAKERFIAFCRSKYNDKPDFLRQIDDFEANYAEEDAVKWYTKSACFVNYVVNTTFAASDFTNYFEIRFILHDLYMQLQKLHDEQSSMWPEPESTLVVFRGKAMPREELIRLPKAEECVVTRGFLSVTTAYGIAEIFSDVPQDDSGNVSVIISMHIDREGAELKPIAFIHDYSEFPEEEEVLLPMGIVFRTTSYEEIPNGDSQGSVRIKMIHSKKEREIEKKLCDSLLLLSGVTIASAAGIAVLATVLPKYLPNNEDREEFNGEAVVGTYEPIPKLSNDEFPNTLVS
jgi:hypothetical protein